ncbi:MAG: hypothetical protein GY938_04210 [Ketobacter sp.]|nr:hypothetical protein [Ketobacter sp.]
MWRLGEIGKKHHFWVKNGQKGPKLEVFGPKRPKPDFFSKNGKCHFHTVSKLQVCGKNIEKSYEQILRSRTDEQTDGRE